jgi:hypothetical protein
MTMPLTPEQREQIRKAKAQGLSRAVISPTPEQRQAWQTAARAEVACKDENVERFLKIKAAAEQPGFFGDVRRAVLLARRPLDDLATAIGVDAGTLSDFRAGEIELPAGVLDRLVEALGLRLMQVIPR